MLITSSSAGSAARLMLRLIVPEKCHIFGSYINILFYILAELLVILRGVRD